MGQFYNVGESKIRPGVYKRYSTNSETIPGAMDGIGAIPIKADWGESGKVVRITGKNLSKTIKEIYGEPSATNGVGAAVAFADGGLSEILIYRVKGTSGAKATVKIEPNEGATGGVTLTAKYEGTKELAVTLRHVIGDNTKKELIVYSGTTEVQRVVYSYAAETEVKNLTEAVNSYDGGYITAAHDLVISATGLKNVEQAKLTGGKNPTVTAEDYSNAFDALEPYQYNVLALDTVDTGVKAVFANYIERAHQNGKHIIGVTGDTTGKKISEYVTEAATFDNEKIVYFASGYINSLGEEVKGVEAIARTAGVIASTPSNQSIVHTKLNGAVDVIDRYTNDDYERAIKGGVLLLSTSSNNEVWYDSGVNTLLNPNSNQDDGWKKIKRVKVRFELFDRIDRALEPKVGKVNCNSDGVGDIIQTAQKVIDAMVAENKLYSGTIRIDENNPYAGDSAWFVIEAYDIDTLEKIYLHYIFSYSLPNA